MPLMMRRIITLIVSFSNMLWEELCILHVHYKRFVHYDLKSANILILSYVDYIADLKLSDFGLSLRSVEAHIYIRTNHSTQISIFALEEFCHMQP